MILSDSSHSFILLHVSLIEARSSNLDSLRLDSCIHVVNLLLKVLLKIVPFEFLSSSDKTLTRGEGIRMKVDSLGLG